MPYYIQYFVTSGNCTPGSQTH